MNLVHHWRNYKVTIIAGVLAVATAAALVWSYLNRGPVVIQPFQELRSSGPVLSVAVGPYNELVAAGTAGLDESVFGVFAPQRRTHGEFTIWRQQDGRRMVRQLEDKWITSVAFVPNSRHVVYGTGFCRPFSDNDRRAVFRSSGEVVVLTTTDFSEVRRLQLEASAYCVRASPQGKYLAVASARSDDKSFLQVFDTRSFAVVLEESFDGPGPFISPYEIEYRPANNVAFSAIGQLMAVGVNDPTPQIIIYDVDLRKQVVRMPLGRPGRKEEISLVAFDPDGKTLLVKATPGVMRWTFDVKDRSLKLRSTIRTSSRVVLPIGRSGGTLFGGGNFAARAISSIAAICDSSRNCIAFLKAPVTEHTLSFAISTDLRRAVAGDSDGRVHLWSLDQLKWMTTEGD